MKPGLGLLLLAALVSILVYIITGQLPEERGDDVTQTLSVGQANESREPTNTDPNPERVVLDISVHTREELQVLFDRAGQLAAKPRPTGREASVVLVLHGPEVEFFSTRNYDRYKNIVDQAAHLDALDVVDIKICQTMMKVRGIERDDIPSFIEQVPLGPAEVDRLVGEGYVYF